MDELYFSWLIGHVTYPPITHLKLLKSLHSIPYICGDADKNCAVHGMDLRRIYSQRTGRSPDGVNLLSPSLLELLIALSMRMEEIVSDPGRGDRTSQWFWSMIVNLGLGNMTDERFDESITHSRVSIFLNRLYNPDGSGGNIYIFNKHNADARYIPLQMQMCWYLDEKG